MNARTGILYIILRFEKAHRLMSHLGSFTAVIRHLQFPTNMYRRPKRSS